MKHPSLPQSLTPELLGQWLVQNAKEKFSEEVRYYYTEDELIDFKDKAVRAGIEINNLCSEKSRINNLLENGNPEYIHVDLMETKGIKALKQERERFEKEVERGFKVETIKIYGIPNQETNHMDFFDVEGNEMPERRRPLSTKEIRDYFGMFAVDFKSKQA